MKWKWPWTWRALNQLDALAGDKPRPWECSKCHALVSHNEFHQCVPPIIGRNVGGEASIHITQLNQMALRMERIEERLAAITPLLTSIMAVRETGVDYSGKDPWGTACHQSMTLPQYIGHEIGKIRRDINALGIQQNDAAAIRREHTERLDELRKMLNDFIQDEALRRATAPLENMLRQPMRLVDVQPNKKPRKSARKNRS